MSNIEKIRQEIERLKKILEESTYYLDNSQQALGYSFALDDFSAFIDSLPDEPVSNDLEEAAEEYIKDGRYLPEAFVVRPAFIAGAEWMEKEINKELIKAMEKVHEIRDVDYGIHVDTSYM